MKLKLKNILLNLRSSGTNSKLREINPFQLVKLITIIFLSNLLFFYACKDEPQSISQPLIPKDWVEIQLHAELLAPFETGKKVILSDLEKNIYINGLLQGQDAENQLLRLMIHEKNLPKIALSRNWKLLPYSKLLRTKPRTKENHYEIYY